jgi:hypothetical protein
MRNLISAWWIYMLTNLTNVVVETVIDKSNVSTIFIPLSTRNCPYV